MSAYPQRIAFDRREATWADVVALLDADYHVGCDIRISAGLTHRALVVQRVGGDSYQVFIPDSGVAAMEGKRLAGLLLSGVEGCRFPE